MLTPIRSTSLPEIAGAFGTAAEIEAYWDNLAAEEAREEAARKMIAEEFLDDPQEDVLYSHLDLGDGPGEEDVIQYLIAQFKAGEPQAVALMRRIAEKVGEHANVERWERRRREQAALDF